MSNASELQRSRDHTSDSSEDTIASSFERQSAVNPNTLAIVSDEISLTYRALDLEASRIAAGLTLLSSPRDRPIVLFMKEEAARIAAMLGVLKSGHIFIPLAPNSPEGWVIQVTGESGAAIIITDRSMHSIAERAATGSVTVMDVEEFARLSEPFMADRSVSPDDTAYIVYTSGSTGRPKGVAQSHRSLIRRSGVRSSAFGLGRDDRYANLRSSGVSSGVIHSLTPLLAGGCLFPFDLHRRGLQELAPWLIAHKITYISFSGALFRTWLGSLPHDLLFPSLRFIRAASEKLYAQDVVRAARHLQGDWRIGHGLASTETGWLASQVFTPSRLPEDGVVAVGRPVEGMDVRIEDESGSPVPPGEIGEIVVRSRFLAQGYWKNPELTAKVFRPDPTDSATRIYRTGDLGRWRTDGMLEHMGRKGRRVRLRGYNVEPFQVEGELMRHSGVTDAVVLLHKGGTDEAVLVGYVVAPPNTSASAIRDGLAERLPSYMVPSHVVVLDSFPLARSGKIDRDALPPPKRDEVHPVACRPPSDEHEHALATIWQDVLKLPKIGIDDDFFDLGGTSLQALSVFARIEARLGCSLSPTTIVQAPTVARLAEFIRTSTGIATVQSLVPLRASGAGLPLFLVHNRYCFVMYYRHLLSALKSDRPVYGLQPLPLDGKHRIPRTIEAMAADYVKEIRRVQPQGPYSLAGHSFGGRVSFEIAQQLVRAGECVSFLGLIDTVGHDGPAAAFPKLSEATRFDRKPRGFKSVLFRLRLARNAAWARLNDVWIRQGLPVPYTHRPNYYDWLCVWANQSYAPKPYPGHITMFSSAGNSARRRAHWGPLARDGLTVLEVPAGHDDMVMPPYSKVLAEYFDACLTSSAP